MMVEFCPRFKCRLSCRGWSLLTMDHQQSIVPLLSGQTKLRPSWSEATRILAQSGPLVHQFPHICNLLSTKRSSNWCWNSSKAEMVESLWKIVFVWRPAVILISHRKTDKDTQVQHCWAFRCWFSWWHKHIVNNTQIPKQQQIHEMHVYRCYQSRDALSCNQNRPANQPSCTTLSTYLSDLDHWQKNRWQVLLEWVGLPSGIQPHVHCIQWVSEIPPSFIYAKGGLQALLRPSRPELPSHR